MYALIENYQWETANERLAYAGRVHSVHLSNASLLRAYGTVKAAALAVGRDRRDLAGVEIVGTVPRAGEEVIHNKLKVQFHGG